MDLMRKSLWLWTMALAACARGGAAPRPAMAPAPERPATVAVAPEPRPDSTVVVAPAPVSVAPVAPRSPADPAPVPTHADSVEAAFLDSMRSAEADSLAPTRVVVAPEEVQREAAALLGGRTPATWDIDVMTYAQHQRVQYWMDYFTGRARWHFERYIERAGRYDSMIRTRLGAAGLPQDMLYLAMIESGFNHSVRSRAGAVGLWQFIPATGRRYGLTVDTWVDDRRDPWKATDAAIRFITELNNRFGSLYLAAAAYNGGPGRVINGLRRYDVSMLDGDAQFFALAESRAFRPETRDYVPKLIAAALLAKQPERYGFAGLVPWQPLRYDSVRVGFAVGLDVLARISGATRGDMEDLNARFHRGVTPPDRTVWVRVPVGTADSVAARLERLPVSDRVTVLVHTVARGETLGRIALRYHTSVSEIREANRGMGRYLRPGQQLTIPGAVMPAGRGVNTRSSGATRTTTRRMTTTTARTATVTRSGATTRGSSAGGARAVRRVHVVRQGETMWSIAQAFAVPVDDLLRHNGMTRRSLLRPGQTVRIPS